MMTYIDSWARVAADLFSQALAGEPELVDALPKPFAAGSFGFAAILSGDQEGRFAVVLDAAVFDAPLLGEGADQKAGWAELLQETFNAAAGELLAKTGKKCRVCCVEKFEESSAEAKVSRAFQLRSGDRAWTILVLDDLVKDDPVQDDRVQDEVRTPKVADTIDAGQSAGSAPAPVASTLSPGLELLLDVELEASLRFGCREMPLGEILDLGPGDVVQLDRHVADPVDLIVGDKIVARGEVVLVNGNFGLRVTEVAAPRKRLESIRCLF